MKHEAVSIILTIKNNQNISAVVYNPKLHKLHNKFCITDIFIVKI